MSACSAPPLMFPSSLITAAKHCMGHPDRIRPAPDLIETLTCGERVHDKKVKPHHTFWTAMRSEGAVHNACISSYINKYRRTKPITSAAERVYLSAPLVTAILGLS
ncbi:hypothetical protein GDO81_027878 [Engystomops pustulosus]|uniref:Uncharacterized protein n=1 Tax=Engystomops pustulosus TaxID=76066 RepID=A0AAV6YDV7_ENGPU|nr:hypothetical protein GDO81_027878 [Engystomops pustulosus]